MADSLPVLHEMDHSGKSDVLTRTQFPTSRPSFYFVFVPTVLLEERAVQCTYLSRHRRQIV